MTKARVSAITAEAARSGHDSMTGSAQAGQGSGSLVHAAAPMSERFSARAARMRSASSVASGRVSRCASSR